jgi:hypothetical protein
MHAPKVAALCAVCTAAAFAAGWTLRPVKTHRDGSASTAADEAAAPLPVLAPSPSRPGREEAAEPAARAAPVRRTLTREEWLRRIAEAPNLGSVRAVGTRLSRLEPEAGRAMALTLLAEVPDPARRRTLLSSLRHHPEMPAIFDAATRDPDVEVQRTAMAGLSRLLGWDVASDLPRYRAWREAHPSASLEDVIREAVTQWVGELRGLSGRALVEEEVRRRSYLKDLAREGPAAAEAARAAGLLDVLARWRTDERLPDDVRAAGFAWLAPLSPSPAEVRAVALPYLVEPGGTTGLLFEAACLLVGETRQDWAVEPLLRAYETTPRRADWWGISAALADLKAVEAIPTMIGMIVADGTYDSVYGIGSFGLGRMVGVTYENDHGGAWWTAWWARNGDRFPEHVRRLGVPTLRPAALATDADG